MPKMYREYGPSDMLNAAPGLYASVNRRKSPIDAVRNVARREELLGEQLGDQVDQR